MENIKMLNGEMLEANNLMVGDFVYYNDSEIWQIEDVSIDGEIGISHIKNGEYESERCSVESLKAIPLDDKMLKKNGVFRSREECIKHYGGLCLITMEAPTKDKSKTFWHTEVGICDRKRGVNVYSVIFSGNFINVQYVHEFQHMLKFNSLGKKADKLIF